MNFDLTDDQLMFRDTVERFCGPFDLASRKRARSLPGGFDRQRWATLAELGLLALPASEAQGGIGGSLADCAVVAEALGYAVAVEPWLELAFWPVRVLDAERGCAVAAGEALIAVGFAEPNGRFRLDPIGTKAVDERLSGEKSFVLGGGAADAFAITAQTSEGPALFFVTEADRRSYTLVDGGLAAELRLRNTPGVRIDGADFEQAVSDTRLIAAAEMLGLAQRLFDDTVTFVKQREQFGQPLGRFQAVQHRLVDCYSALEQMRSTLWRALLNEGGEGRVARVAGAKAFVAERALKIGHEAIQLHGGMGVTDELVVGHAHKRVLLLSKLFGDPAADLLTYAEAA
jgi:hypothetical protein